MRKNKKQRIRLKHEKMRNKRLIKKYPWLLPRNVWTDKVPDDYDYSYVEWYGWPRGWNIAFGDMFLNEFGEAVKDAGLERTIRIWQMKEKYGSMRCYTNGGNEKIDQIIDKYGHISENICVACGKPDVPMINDGWFSPLCYDCWCKNYKRYRSSGISDEEMRQKYDDCVCDENPEIANTYTIRRFSEGGYVDTTYDISETADAIRERWIKRGRNSRKRN